MTYMLDTNAFNNLLDDDFDLLKLKGSFVTVHIQKDELSNTKKEERRKKLLEIFSEVNPEKKPTESFVLGLSPLGGDAKLGNGKTYEKILRHLEEKKPQHRNNKKDALICECALANKYFLVTNDKAMIHALNCSDTKSAIMDYLTFKKVILNE